MSLNYMNKYLREIDIFASNYFGQKNCRLFVDETRIFVDSVYEKLENNVISDYGKIIVMLWPKSRLDKFLIPYYEYDDISGVCTINYPYDLSRYLNEDSREYKIKIIYDILRCAFENSQNEMGLDRKSLSDILTAVYEELE